MLKDKYAKFTPLVFLTNFVFAYQKFQRRLEEEQVQQRQEDYSALIDDVTAVVQKKFSPKEESSQQLVKLIKSETQTRLLEQRCEILQAKQAELLRELGELRIRQATDTEHWSTIEALFGKGVPKTHSQVDAETNTEAVTPPIPAMRRAAQLIDRQLSMQLGQAVEQMLGELKPPEICTEYGIIKDNYQLDYITAEDFEKHQQELADWRSKQADLQRETKQLEGLLRVANEQVGDSP